MNQRRTLLRVVPFIAVLCMAADASAQQRVFKLVEIQKDPPCSSWSAITSCAPNGGSITWGGAYNTTYTWTVPPDTIGPDGTYINLSVEQSNPVERKVATGLRMTGSGFVFSQTNADVAVGAGTQPLNGKANVAVKPAANVSGEVYLRIGVYYGPGFTYRYRADVSSDSPPKTTTSDRPSSIYIGEVRAGEVTGDVLYHKGGTAPGAWLPVERDTVLKAGDHITTAADASVTLYFADNSTVVVTDATQFSIASYFTEGGVVRAEILMQMGELRWKVMKAAFDELHKSDFRIKTPTDVSSVRGTTFSTRYDPRTQTSTTTVEEGVVDVTPTNTSLAPVTLRAGQQVKVTPTRVFAVTSTATPPPIAVAAPTAASAGSLAVGTWRWSWLSRETSVLEERGTVTLNGDGNASSSRGARGTWRQSVNVITIRWSDRSVDELNLSVNGLDMTGRTDQGTVIRAFKQ